jgi:hypothetical protein
MTGRCVERGLGTASLICVEVACQCALETKGV